MTIILRLQGLDEKAGSEDIRTFFKNLHIPDGGVYIVGGSLKEAFIAFNNERDAQLAMRYSGNDLKGSKVTLHISSMKELEHKLKSLLKRKKRFPTQFNSKSPEPSPETNLPPLNAGPHTPVTANLPELLNSDTLNSQVSNTLDSSTAFFLGICTVLQGLQSCHQSSNNVGVPSIDLPKTDDTVVSNEVRIPEHALGSKPGYVRLFGLPVSATKDDICRFFRGLKVQEAIVNVKLGLGYGCLVKFASSQEAHEALLFNKQSFGPICVEVRGATEKMWTSALQECENALDVGETVKPKQSPLKETVNHKPHSTALKIKRRSVSRLPSKSPKMPRPDSNSTTALSPPIEYTVMVRNLQKTMTKTEIKELLGCPNIAHKNVLHLLDKEGNRTNTAFLIFNCIEDYDYAINLSGCHVGSDVIEVSSITRKIMRDMMAETHPRNLKIDLKKKPDRKKKSNPVKTPVEPSMKVDP